MNKEKQTKIRDYIMLNLGSPIINIEIHDDMVYSIINDCIDVMKHYGFKTKKIYNNHLFRLLCVAECGIMWGNNVNKYIGSMPDGFSINGSGIIKLYSYKRAVVYEEIQRCAAPIIFTVG